MKISLNCQVIKINSIRILIYFLKYLLSSFYEKVKKILQNIKEAIALYLESLQVDGLPIPDENHLILEVEATYEQITST